MVHARIQLIWLSIAWLPLAGCGDGAKPLVSGKADPANAPAPTNAVMPFEATETPAKQNATSTRTAIAASAPAIELQESNWNELLNLVGKHKGKIVVVDIWSTSCEPCLREFPHLVALQKTHPRDVVCVSFDCDFIGAKNKPVAYYRERVLKSLTQMNASTIINLMSTVAADDLFMQLDLDSIPAVCVFDRDGKLAKRFDNRTPAGGNEEGISYETQIIPLVTELVKAAN